MLWSTVKCDESKFNHKQKVNNLNYSNNYAYYGPLGKNSITIVIFNIIRVIHILVTYYC